MVLGKLPVPGRPTETTLYESKHVCDYLSMYKTLLLRMSYRSQQDNVIK